MRRDLAARARTTVSGPPLTHAAFLKARGIGTRPRNERAVLATRIAELERPLERAEEGARLSADERSRRRRAGRADYFRAQIQRLAESLAQLGEPIPSGFCRACGAELFAGQDAYGSRYCDTCLPPVPPHLSRQPERTRT